MSYRCVIVSNPAHISTRSEQLVVETDERHTVPIEDISALMLESRRATFSAAALSALAQNGTAVFVCDEKHLPCGVLLPYAQHSRQLAAARAQLSLTLPAKNASGSSSSPPKSTTRRNVWRCAAKHKKRPFCIPAHAP